MTQTLLDTPLHSITAAIEEKQLAHKNLATKRKSPSMKNLVTTLLILLTVPALLYILLIFALDSAHDNMISRSERTGILLVPGILVVVIAKRLIKG